MLQRDRGYGQQVGRIEVADEGHKGQQVEAYSGENGRGARAAVRVETTEALKRCGQG